MVCRNTYPSFLCDSFFYNIKAGHDIDGKGWLYEQLSWGGGGGYKIVLRGKGAVWLLDRFYIKYPACFLHRLS